MAHCADHLEPQANWLLQTLQGFKDQGKGLVDGATVDIGWSRLTLRRQGDDLLICEPDFAGNPFQELSPDVSRTLTVLAQQRDLLQCLQVDGDPARFDDKVVLARGALQQTRIYLERSPPTSGDSGWYVGSAEDDSDASEDAADYEAMYVYQLLDRRPSLLQALALPTSYLVVFDRDRIEAVLDATGTEIWAGRRN